MEHLKSKLDELEQKLRDKGVVDVKFHIDWSKNPSPETLASDLINVIEAILDGNTTPYIPTELGEHIDNNFNHCDKGY